MGRVVHFEIHAEHPPRAIQFYENIFGWKFEKWEGPQDYWLITTGPDSEPGINGGLVRRREPVAQTGSVEAYVCTVDVASLDKTIDQVIDQGGLIVFPKTAIPNVGWLAYAKDTEGNLFGMMQSDSKAK